ncbi:hypothetical protein B0H13DRAFT_1905970 [Mycena leptocephala]|nr:hypothetical protein B0H13DRAFT_1905970 [Mycena leptocephala]
MRKARHTESSIALQFPWAFYMGLKRRSRYPLCCTCISFILTPALLIAEDMDIPMDEAHDIRDDSNEFGDVMQPDEDGDGGALHDLHRANIRAMKEQGSPEEWVKAQQENHHTGRLPRDNLSLFAPLVSPLKYLQPWPKKSGTKKPAAKENRTKAKDDKKTVKTNWAPAFNLLYR